MELSDFPMKKQIVFGQIWKRLVIIVFDLNYYELILAKVIYIGTKILKFGPIKSFVYFFSK